MTGTRVDYSIESMGNTWSIYSVAKYTGIGVRILITALGAVLLMLVAAYPSALIAQEPYITLPWVSHAFLLEWKNWLWVAPWLLMEIAAIAGPRRNLVWYSGLVGVIVLTMLAYPIIQATRPELIHQHFSEKVYQLTLEEVREKITILADNSPYLDRCLEFGLAILWAVLGLSLFIRTVVLGYFISINEKQPENEFNTIDMADIAPNAENARTVKEIAADGKKIKSNFKFGEADHNLVAYLRRILKRLQYLRTIKGLCWLSAVLFVVLWFFLYPQPTQDEALARDLKAMYETTTDAEGNEIGTTRAVYAAMRVLQHIEEKNIFEGMTVAEAEKWLRMEQASDAYRETIRTEGLKEAEFTPLKIRTLQSPNPRAHFMTITDGRHHAVMLFFIYNTALTSDKESIPPLKPNHVISYTYSYEFGWDKKRDLEESHPYLYTTGGEGDEEVYQFNNFSFF